MKKIVIFGTGGLAHLLSKSTKESTKIVAYLDTVDLLKKKIGDIPVLNRIEDIKNIEYDYVVVAFAKVYEGIGYLVKAGIDKKRIVGYSFLDDTPYIEKVIQKKVDLCINNELLNDSFEELFTIPKKKFYLCGMNIIGGESIIEQDYVREQTLYLLAKEIKRKRIDGSVAELGVFRGDFSKKINKLFPEKELYLFDTFEGFDQRDIEGDSTLTYEFEKLDPFSDTSVDKCLNKMEYADKCIIKKGYFPQSFDLKDTRFAFVSIDVDLYDPIKAGLEVFYPLLNKGGYIMVHDYNNILYTGTMEAVLAYCDERNISYVPIPDVAGSIVISK